MAEQTKTTGCTDYEWEAAKKSGLLFAPLGSGKQEEAIHKFAELIRQQESSK